MNEEMLTKLRKLNPELPLYSVFDKEFEPYGRVLELDGLDAMAKALDTVPIPERGNHYERALGVLDAQRVVADISHTVFGGMGVQAGYCNGRGHILNAMEYHKCSEVNFSTTGLVLLLALPGTLHDGSLDSRDVVGFYLPPMVAVEVSPLVMHFAPCSVREGGFNCLVVLEEGVNTPLTHVDTTAAGEEKLLWMRNKWLTCHPDSPQAANGAFVGISGENIVLSL